MSDVLNLINEMEGYFEECKSVPFSNRIIVDMEVMYEFMTDLRLKLPEEIRRSQRILDEKERIVEDAKREAQAAESKAAARVAELVDDNVITQHAHEAAQEMMKIAEQNARETIDKANYTASEIKAGAFEYVEKIVGQVELAITDTMEQANLHYGKFENYMAQQAKVMANNREELTANYEDDQE